jgi:mono/diheme cytochrome c family protein
MRKRAFWSLLSVCPIFLFGADCRSTGDYRQPPKSEAPRPEGAIWHTTRTSPLDLELGGDLVGLALGAKRYVSRQDLLALPQVSYTVTDDLNFNGSTGLRGVELELLARTFAAEGEKALVVVTCVDLFRAHYPQAYVQAHQPLLVLEINGQGPDAWPKSREGLPMGPYVISHPHFIPSFKTLSQEDEAQIPWGVLRLEFRNEKKLLDSIAPVGPTSGEPAVQAGYRIAQQLCLHCHSTGTEPLKGKWTWAAIGMMAASAPSQFAAYVRNPRGTAQYAEMPAYPNYDDATLEALTSYFRTFDPAKRP